MSDTKEAARILKAAVKTISSEIGNTALQNFSNEMNILSSVSIPFELLPNQKTKDIIPYVKEFGLNKPENMIRFLVELNFASFESISDGIGSIRGDLLKSVIAKIDSAKDGIRYANKKDGEKREQKLSECLSKLSEAQKDLEYKIKDYIGEIYQIDNRSVFSFFMRSKLDLSKVDNTVALATAGLQAYIETARLLSYIKSLSDDEDIDDFITDAKKYINDLTANKSLSLMAAYDVKKEDTYWNSDKLNAELESIQELSDELTEFFEDSYEEEVDFENDIAF